MCAYQNVAEQDATANVESDTKKKGARMGNIKVSVQKPSDVGFERKPVRTRMEIAASNIPVLNVRRYPGAGVAAAHVTSMMIQKEMLKTELDPVAIPPGHKFINTPKVESTTKKERVKFMDTTDKNRKQLSGLLSFFIPGAGQLLNAIRKESSQDGIKALAFFFGTMIGFALLVLPGIVIWIWAIIDAYKNALPNE